MVRVSDVVNYLRCPRLSYFSIHSPEDFPSELKAAREIFLSLRKGLGYEWAYERFSTLYPDSRDVFVEASQKFVLSDELEKLKPVEWEKHFYSEKLGLRGTIDEVHESSFLWVSLRVPKKERFEDKIKAACYSLLSGIQKAYIYYCYDGKLKRVEFGRREKYNALRIIEKVKKVEKGLLPERKESYLCEKCRFRSSCFERKSTFASKFL